MPDEPKKTAPKKAAPGTREYDPETGKFLDGPHPEDYEDGDVDEKPAQSPESEEPA